MEIQGVFDNIRTYEKLNEIAEKVEPKISFWGTKYLVVEGYEGFLDIDAIRERVLGLAEENPDFNETERELGRKISKRVDYIFDRTHELIRDANFFTKILVFIKYATLNSPELYWYEFERNFVFDSYTPSQFKRVFGYPIKKAKNRGIILRSLEYDNQRFRILPNAAT